MSNKTEICYRCGKPASSREHVPPLCLFPEQKDCDGINYRKDLITVPSCDEHNSKKSSDDEFLMMILAGIVGNNATAFLHLHTKVVRALQRKGEDYQKRLMRDARHFTITTPKGAKFPVLKGLVDMKRLMESFELISYGLFYHEFGNVFKGDTRMLLSPMIEDDPNQREVVRLLKVMAEKEGAYDISNIKGANPDIFSYVFLPPDKSGIFSLKMNFYKGTEIFVCFLPEGQEVPFDLTFSLIKAGFKTTIREGGREFHFNKKKPK